MLSRIFPKTADNNYRGHWLGVACLIVVTLLKAAQGTTILVNTHDTLIGADGIPVDTFAAAPAATAIGMFALLGMYTLLLPTLSLVVLVRWRTLVPLMLLMLVIVQAGARMVQTIFPIPRVLASGIDFAGQPIGFWVNLGILAVTIAGLGLSLMQRANSRTRPLAEGAR